MSIIERRTQEQRSAETRKLLLAATVQSLMEVGYANTTTAGIARRAGVSRGAQTHHFPDKMALIVSATEEMFENFAAGLEGLAADLREGRLTYDGFFDEVWADILKGEWFYSSLEIIVAARGDAESQGPSCSSDPRSPRTFRAHVVADLRRRRPADRHGTRRAQSHDERLSRHGRSGGPETG
ncbi:TetR/AcrR family transcriptional regulator [Jiella pelagia]|uniref:TetR/AcrR family transcriptional regulator n=1 Tax=Jiella pelagia TaxID=2986949 RepID=A0ABY7BXW8_9HYPH|nr:TetR/AcrR family transcriptional regulator [Jiella pelagia]WAP67363.1 TetR/AcrR family transcriptional regulator [Jiella pelagia]